jgi:hypothetical protein
MLIGGTVQKTRKLKRAYRVFYRDVFLTVFVQFVQHLDVLEFCLEIFHRTLR